MELIKIEDGQLAEITVEAIKTFETKMKELSEQYDKFKSDLLNAMEEHGILKFENDNVRVNYFAEQTGLEVFNKKQFQADMPELYDEYCSLDGKKKAYIKISVKK